MMFPIFFLDEGSGGGAGGGEGAAGDTAEADSKPTTDGGEGASGGSEGGAAKNAARETTKTKTGATEGDKVDYESEYKRLTEENSHLKKKVGTVANRAAILDKMEQAATKDPKKALQFLAKNFGINEDISFGKSQTDNLDTLLKAAESGDEAAIAKLKEDNRFANMMAQIENRISQKMSPLMENLKQEYLSKKYDDWDDIADDRSNIGLAHKAGQMDTAEIMHLAARGANMGEAIEDAKKQAVEEYVRQLEEKHGGHIDGTSGRTKRAKPDNSIDFAKVSEDLNSMLG